MLKFTAKEGEPPPPHNYLAALSILSPQSGQLHSKCLKINENEGRPNAEGALPSFAVILGTKYPKIQQQKESPPEKKRPVSMGPLFGNFQVDYEGKFKVFLENSKSQKRHEKTIFWHLFRGGLPPFVAGF